MDRLRGSLVATLSLSVVLAMAPATAFASPAPAAPDFDCGVATCTMRVDRQATAALQDFDDATGVGSALCGATVAAGVAPGVFCAAAVNAAGIAIARFAKEVYADGDCVGLRVVTPTLIPLPPPAPPPIPVVFPVRVEAGTFNCR
jgi:hypothetical protein